MATSPQTADTITSPEIPGTYVVREPVLVQYEAQIWSCAEQRQIYARLYYSVSLEQQGRTCSRLLFIEPLSLPPRIN